MTNPFQPTSSSFAENPLFSPSPLGQRRTSYASVASGAPGAASARPPRSAHPFSYLLNPSPDSDMHGNYHASYRTPWGGAGQNMGRHGNPGEDNTPGMGLHPRVSNSLPWFSRAFDPWPANDPLYSDGLPEDGPGLASPAKGASFLAPSYLSGSAYLQQLNEAHRARLLAERETFAAKMQSSSGMATAGGPHSPTSKPSSGAHRGVQYDVVEKTTSVPEIDATVNPLPSRWNRDDKDSSLDVMDDGLTVKHIGRSSSDHEACAIRANHYMPPLCGIYYFEVTILNRKREDTTIAIGFSSRTVSLQRAPGWEPESWGYHGDDGHSFSAQNVGKTFGPKFGPGDTVGCLVNFRLGHAMFTKNGEMIGTAFRGLDFRESKIKAYPTVGLKRPGDHVMANFGHTPFHFDIDGYVKKEQKLITEHIKEAVTTNLVPGLSETKMIQMLVLQFLQHDGYVETARAFAEEINAEQVALNVDPNKRVPGINIKDDEDANNRQRIRRAILDGDIDSALKLTKRDYPSVLEQNEQVYFRLRCRKFIEMIRREAEHCVLLERKNKNQPKFPLAGGDDGDDTRMTEIDTWYDKMDTEYEVDDMAVTKLSHETLEYGLELRTEFSNDPRKEISKHLDDIFVLMAYASPHKVKEVAHLLEDSARVPVAEELNSAILMSLGKSSRAALENLYAQTSVLLEDLRQDGGVGAFVVVRDVIDQIPKPDLF